MKILTDENDDGYDEDGEDEEGGGLFFQKVRLLEIVGLLEYQGYKLVFSMMMRSREEDCSLKR